MVDLIQNLNDSIEVEPADLSAEFIAVMTTSLAKTLASQYEKPWTDDQESKMQEEISALVAAANERNLKTIRVIVTQATGQKASRELDIEQISKTRSLQ